MNYRTTLIKLFTFLGGIYFFLKFVLPETIHVGSYSFSLAAYNDQISTGFVTVGAMALGLGLVNLLASHGSAIVFLRKGWINSGALLLGLFGMLLVSFMDWHASNAASSKAEQIFLLRDFADRIVEDAKASVAGIAPWYERNAALKKATEDQLDSLNSAALAPHLDNTNCASEPYSCALIEAIRTTRAKTALLVVTAGANSSDFAANTALAQSLVTLGSAVSDRLTFLYEQSLTRKEYRFFYNGLFVSLGSAMFSLLGFYIASAAYRAFRVRSLESGLMMGAALLVILGQVPFMLFGSGKIGTAMFRSFPQIRLWLLSVPNTAAFRAIELGAAIGALVMAFRMWFSIESESFSAGEGGKKR